MLQTWSIGDTVQVGFEILVPCLLRLLEQHGIRFKFAGHRRLLELHEEKVKCFEPEIVYADQAHTLLHSLEALIGLIDFDQVGHHCTKKTGMFGSPSATAAYLIYCSSWDDKAESYLRATLRASGNGTVPSAFPTCVFEIAWVSVSWPYLGRLCDGIWECSLNELTPLDPLYPSRSR